MGGILSAEAALLAPYSAANRETYRHRILGTVNFDTPFLGMHPGVIVSGIGSLFKPKPASPTLKPLDASDTGNTLMPMPQQLATPNGTFAGSGLLPMPRGKGSSHSEYFPDQNTESLRTPTSPLSPLATPINDPNFDPPFPNDVRLPVRKGWDSTLHFIMKHSDGLTKATKSYVTSHLEFGGALADYRGLKARYERLRALEDVDDSAPESMQEYRPPRRIRFVNYYTASTGRSTYPKPATPHDKEHTDHQLDGPSSGLEERLQRATLSTASNASTRSASRSPRISIEDPRGETVTHIVPNVDEDEDPAEAETHSSPDEDMNHLDPSPATDDEAPLSGDGSSESRIVLPANYHLLPLGASLPDPTPTPTRSSTLSSALTLPPLPPLPTPPPPFDPTPYPSKDLLKLATQEHARLLKAHARALKDRDRAIAARRKVLAKRDKAADKALQEEEKARLKDEAAENKTRGKEEREREREREREKARSVQAREGESAATDPAIADPTPPPPPPKNKDTNTDKQKQKPPRDRKFCMLPPRGADGARDAAWVRTFMLGVDEVGAHCGLFVAGKPHYEALVLDVGTRVEGWVRGRGGREGR